MDIPEKELERIIYDVIVDFAEVNPPLERNEIAQHVLDHVCPDVRRLVYAALERMIGNGVIATHVEANPEDRPVRYGLAAGVAGRH